MPAPMPLLHESRTNVRRDQIPGARTALLSALPPSASSSIRGDVALAFSELATNVIRHSGVGPDEEFVLRMYGGDDAFRIEVEDAGAGFDLPAMLPLKGDGWGLRIVERLAADWGVRPGARPPTVVWFELPLQP